MKKILLSLLCLLPAFLFAQQPEVEMADTMRSNGKIYVVLAVVLVIFAGLIIYLISIDRKVSRMEKDASSKAQREPEQK
jgi:protein-S-isoprenylcysteine O-methyltransferase Ste14